jgi:hypothetical protein
LGRQVRKGITNQRIGKAKYPDGCMRSQLTHSSNEVKPMIMLVTAKEGKTWQM